MKRVRRGKSGKTDDTVSRIISEIEEVLTKVNVELVSEPEIVELENGWVEYRFETLKLGWDDGKELEFKRGTRFEFTSLKPKTRNFQYFSV